MTICIGKGMYSILTAMIFDTKELRPQLITSNNLNQEILILNLKIQLVRKQ
jgi:hypothetical protein